MDSGFDNSIYWIISHVVATIHYYSFKIAVSMTHKKNYNTLKVTASTTELPWTPSSWRILESSSLRLLNWTELSLNLSLTLRPTVSRPVCLWIKHASGAYDQIFIIVWQLRVCWFGALSLTRGRVCRLQLLLVLASAVVFGSVSRRTRGHILLSQIRDFLTRIQSQSRSYITTDGQPASLSWNKAPIWGLQPDLDYCLTVVGLLIWGALSDERTGLSFAISTGPRQRSRFRVRVP
jgi:hypothetical protein